MSPIPIKPQITEYNVQQQPIPYYQQVQVGATQQQLGQISSPIQLHQLPQDQTQSNNLKRLS